jgi:hypothetical protein
MKAKQLYGAPSGATQHATNRVQYIRNLRTVFPTVPWSGEVKDKEQPVIIVQVSQLPHKKHRTTPSRPRKLCFYLVLATTPHRQNATERILIHATPKSFLFGTKQESFIR